MNLVLFEDDLVERLYPITIGRPAFAVTCGGYRLFDLVSELAAERGHSLRCVVRPHLQTLAGEDYAPHPKADAAPPRDAPTLLVNARLVPSATSWNVLGNLLKQDRPGIVQHGPSIAAALVPQRHSLPADAWQPATIAEHLAALALEPVGIELPLFDYPHDVIRYHQAVFDENLARRIARGDYTQQADGVFLAPRAALGEHVVTDTRRGPILLEEGATVGPFSYLAGPIRLGPGCRVIEHASIKDGVSLGHTTKIGGEIEASVIEPYTNKQHHGFMGHSYLGSWINLGAGTCNSDLKNTYGMVKMEYGRERVNTGMQFVGCIIGDYAKTAINTGIFTGKTIGVCSMVYGFVTTNVPSFVNYARSFGQVTETPAEVLAATQARMFARRDVPQRPCDVELLHAMYSLTRHERQLAGEPLSL